MVVFRARWLSTEDAHPIYRNQWMTSVEWDNLTEWARRTSTDPESHLAIIMGELSNFGGRLIEADNFHLPGPERTFEFPDEESMMHFRMVWG